MSLMGLPSSDYAQYLIEQRENWQTALLGDPLRDVPGAAEFAKNNGYKLGPDGIYRQTINAGGVTFVDAQTPESLKHKYQSAQYLKNAAAIPDSTPDYLSQIMPMLNAQRATQAQGGASSGQYSNPYEQRLAALINNPDAIENTNAYKFRFNQGQQALERSAAAKGMLNSGNTLAELARYGQGMASEEYGNEFNRLATATGQRNQYNLGLMGAANQEYALRSQDRQNDTGIALKALMGSDEMYNQRKKLALDAATAGGMLKTGNQQKNTATW